MPGGDYVWSNGTQPHIFRKQAEAMLTEAMLTEARLTRGITPGDLGVPAGYGGRPRPGWLES